MSANKLSTHKVLVSHYMCKSSLAFCCEEWSYPEHVFMWHKIALGVVNIYARLNPADLYDIKIRMKLFETSELRCKRNPASMNVTKAKPLIEYLSLSKRLPKSVLLWTLKTWFWSYCELKLEWMHKQIPAISRKTGFAAMKGLVW